MFTQEQIDLINKVMRCLMDTCERTTDLENIYDDDLTDSVTWAEVGTSMRLLKSMKGSNIIYTQEELVDIYYTKDGRWSDAEIHSSTSISVPANCNEGYVVGIICALTGVTKYAKYMLNNPESDQPLQASFYE